LPFLMIISLVTYAGVYAHAAWDNTIAGRLLYAGGSLTALDPLQLFGLRTSNIFEAGYSGDSGYGYVLVKIGLAGLLAIWALFVYAPVVDSNAWRFKNFIAFYVVFLLTISASLFSIKTAALLWFLYGTLNNPNLSAGPNSSAARYGAIPESID
jgi:putative polymerase